MCSSDLAGHAMALGDGDKVQTWQLRADRVVNLKDAAGNEYKKVPIKALTGALVDGIPYFKGDTFIQVLGKPAGFATNSTVYEYVDNKGGSGKGVHNYTNYGGGTYYKPAGEVPKGWIPGKSVEQPAAAQAAASR